VKKFIAILLILIVIFSNISNAVEVDDEVNNKVEVEVDVNVQDEEENDEIIISLVGDTCFDGALKKHIGKYGISYPWDKVSSYFKEDDLTVVNLETSATTGGKKWPDKQYNFRSNPNSIKGMAEAGVEVATLANNHVLDYGYSGLLDTLKYLDKYNIKYTGAGKNKKEAIEGVIVEVKGVKIGIVSFSRVIPDMKWYATNKRPGLVSGYDYYVGEMTKKIAEMKKKSDIVILSIHWGVERSTTPRKQEINVAKKAIESGADIVMGHHPHVLQGIQVYKGKPIFYSLGNFIFNSGSKAGTNTMIGQVYIKDKTIQSINVIPCKIVNGRPIPLSGEKKAGAINNINKLSKPFGFRVNGRGIMEIK
jgi:poly-gamma-glutamate capsule biosynthesis protein CapA/YwtB (metallophosphatase superfamily)